MAQILETLAPEAEEPLFPIDETTELIWPTMFSGQAIYDIITMFYFILDQKPLADLQTQIHPSQAGMPLNWLSSWIVIYAQLIGLFMDTPASITEKSIESFKNSPP
ncbi:unnamed protein product [Fusarium graminearum]|nr:unnamed protein product [Fusarium graminearum]CAG1997823.1 unnamed protein product [Fusarium graminearum]VTO93020.1 unnamed protein product [Fusarium graminearum]